jgi:uncharacterized protein
LRNIISLFLDMEKNPVLYVNLIIEDLSKAIDFYTTLGFVQNMQFSDEKAAAMMWKTDFAVMLLTKGFAQGFLPAHKAIAAKDTCSALYALEFPSKEAVDSFVRTAIEAGGVETKDYDYGFMYGRDFEDLDGHIWEAFWMDPTGIPQE